MSRRWERETVYPAGDPFFAAVEAAIAAARESVTLETYIFERDALGIRILEGLAAAAARGARVRVLVDGFGSPGWTLPLLRELAARRIEARIHRPLPWPYSQRTPREHSLGWQFGKLNRRNHRKTCVIDAKTAFVGGMNINAQATGEFGGPAAWRDTSVRVEGADVVLLCRAFERVWSHHGRVQEFRKTDLVLLNDGILHRHRLHQLFNERVAGARARVWLTTPYFSPDLALLRALRAAVRAGADVRILLPSRNDVFFMKWVNRGFYSVLLAAGVRVHEYLPSMLHAKIVVADDWVTVGSSNRNRRSLFRDLEVDVVLTHPESLGAIVSQFQEDLARSREILPAAWLTRSRFGRLLERLTALLRRWV